jgi:hypothetical protein
VIRDWSLRRLEERAECLGAVEWVLLALIVLGVAVTIAMAIFDP